MSFFPPVTVDTAVVRELTNIKRMSDIHGKSASEENLKQYLEETSVDMESGVCSVEREYEPAPANMFSPK